jgi:hypothetical protein
MATFAGIVIYSMEMDSQRGLLLKEKAALREEEESIGAKVAAIDKAKMRIEALMADTQNGKGLVARRESVNKTKAEVGSRVAQLEKVAPQIKSALVAAVAEVRLRAVGEELPEVALTTGTILRPAKIQKVGESEVSFGHSQGVTRVAWKNLPPELIARFRFSDPPAVATKSGDASTRPEDGESAAPALVQPSPSDVSGRAASTQTRDLESRVAKLQLQINQARRSQQNYRQKAGEYRALHYRAQALGRSSSHLVKAQEAQKQIEAIEDQIRSAEDQIRRLDVEIREHLDSSQ